MATKTKHIAILPVADDPGVDRRASPDAHPGCGQVPERDDLAGGDIVEGKVIPRCAREAPRGRPVGTGSI